MDVSPFVYLFAAVWALILGSFATVCVHRIPRGQSIVRPASRCPHCGKPIRWRHNIPVFGFIFLGGRCFSCRRPIPWRYPAMEALLVALFAALVWRYSNQPVMWALGAFLTWYLLVISVIDLELKIIPDVLSLSLLAAGLAASPFNPLLGYGFGARAAEGLLGALFGFSIMVAIALGGKAIWKRDALGGGDVKLMAALGAFLGWQGVIATLFLGSLAGTLWAGSLLVMKKIQRGSYIPFGPFLALGALIFWFCGRDLRHWWPSFGAN
jgi:leader peptidase (prepilin peptidase) / N-methyltransferase